MDFQQHDTVAMSFDDWLKHFNIRRDSENDIAMYRSAYTAGQKMTMENKIEKVKK